MLTAELLDYRRRQGAVQPRLLDPAAPAVLAASRALLDRVRSQVGEPRHRLDELLRDAEPLPLPSKAAAGLARLLLERCTFETVAPVPPMELRRAVFDAGEAAWRAPPGAPDANAAAEAEPGAPAWRSAALHGVAAALGLDAAALDAALFADLEDNQVLLAFDPLRPEELPYRYNVAQVQGLLLRAEHITLRAPWPEQRRLRQLMRYLKFYRLLFREQPTPAVGVVPPADAELRLLVDGPLSVLESATAYGLELAQFFPALLLWDQPWRLEAQVRLGKGRQRATLRLEPHPWLRSHYPDHGQWIPAEVERFVAAFNAGRSIWRAAPAEALLSLPGNRSLVPDFEFRRPGAAPVYLEHLPYPDATRLAERLAELRTAGRRDYLLACRAAPAVKALGERPGLLIFRRSLLPGPVAKALEALQP